MCSEAQDCQKCQNDLNIIGNFLYKAEVYFSFLDFESRTLHVYFMKHDFSFELACERLPLMHYPTITQFRITPVAYV